MNGRKLAFVIAISGAVGCNDQATTLSLKNTPAVDVAAAIMKSVDANGDGKLTADELASHPGLAAGAARIDQDKDQILTNDELLKRLETYATGPAMIAMTVTVTQKGRLVEGASVSLKPEDFVGPEAQAFIGTTDRSGTCEPDGEKSSTPGVPVGYYQAHITQQETGIDKVLGCEIANDASGDRIDFRL
jgi:hypothetical protein